VLVDDDFYSARLLMRMLEAHGGPFMARMADPESAIESLLGMAAAGPLGGPCLVIVDLKFSSTATRDFVVRLKDEVPNMVVVAMAPSLDRTLRNELLDAGAAAVFERHSELNLYRTEAANIVSFWARCQRLDAVGT
jgi:DNA-binding NarL/FixJ family response regulator